MDGARQRVDGIAAGDGLPGRPPRVPAARAVPGATGDAIRRRPTGCLIRPDPTAVYWFKAATQLCIYRLIFEAV